MEMKGTGISVNFISLLSVVAAYRLVHVDRVCTLIFSVSFQMHR